MSSKTPAVCDQSFYRHLFDFAPHAYVVTDRNGLIVEANRSAAQLVAADLTRLRGKPLFVFVEPDDRSALRRELVRMRDALEPLIVEFGVYPGHGGTRRVKASVMAVGRGVDMSLRWALDDVTEQRVAEAEVRALAVNLERLVRERTSELTAERTQLREIIQHLPAAAVIVDARTGAVVLKNDHADAIGVIAMEVGRPVPLDRLPAYHPDGRPYEANEWPLARALRGETVPSELINVKLDDGRTYWQEVSAAPVRDDKGELTAAVVTFQDVSDRHERERVQREFVTNAAHELRTPIASIASAVEVLQSGAKEVPEDRDRFLGHIERATERLGRLGRALLTLARAQTGDERPKHKLVQLCTLLKDTATDLDVPAGVEVAVECPSDLATVTNPDLLEQALTNLAQNAVKHTRDGQVTLSARATDVDVLIEVADTGSGLAAVDPNRVFDRFYRGRDVDDGFGLGLTIASESIRALGGRLELEPRDGGGTIARIAVPLAKLVAA